MPQVPPTQPIGRLPGSWQRATAALVILLGVLVISLPGCSGCTSEDPARVEAEKKKKEEAEKKKKKKPDFESGDVAVQPTNRTKDISLKALKPGHWVSVVQPMKANNFDFVGELEGAVVDQNGDPVYLDRTPFRLTTTRPAALPKGQQKYLDMTLFVPHASRTTRVSTVVRGRSSSGQVNSQVEFFQAMPPYQYHLVVLAKNPNQYSFVKVLDSVQAPWNDKDRDAPFVYYKVVEPQLTKKPIALPAQALAWTSVAYVLWDDVDPALLSQDQQVAIVDWLHWGGQIIVNGPSSLDALAGSFLAPYLPATAGEARTLAYDDLAEFSANWTPKSSRAKPLAVTKPWAAIQLQKDLAAEAMASTDGLLIERAVGRGRIVVSAFHLHERDLRNWKGLDNFFNACLLRRGPREYFNDNYDLPCLTWLDRGRTANDPRWVSGLRFFSRDLGVTRQYAPQSQERFDELGQLVREDAPVAPEVAGGVASWNDLDGCSDAARESLRRAAGIKVPKAQFVIWTLGLYLLVVVPLNWLLFYIVGRVEWAWFSAPVIAVVFAGIVTRLAHLDIGFVRMHTEIGVLEIPGNYTRGHLSRYTALYTSLSTTYDIHLADTTAVVQPFPVEKQFTTTATDRAMVEFRRAADNSLSGLTISSNSTGMVHSEQMFELGGAIKLGRATNGQSLVINGSKLDLKFAGILHKRRVGKKVREEFAWIGELPAGRSATYEFLGASDDGVSAFAKFRNAATDTLALDLAELERLALRWEHMAPGEMRLVASYDGLLSGEEVSPTAAQLRAAALVVVNLTYPERDDPQPDANTRQTPQPESEPEP